MSTATTDLTADQQADALIEHLASHRVIAPVGTSPELLRALHELAHCD